MDIEENALCGPLTDRGYNMGCATGLPFWPLSPEVSDVRIQDIAAHLSRLCRYGGALRDDVDIYTVAQHSLLVSFHVPEKLAMEGLLHDAAEAYLGDMIRPLKRQMPEYRAVYARVDSVIRRKFGLLPEEPAEVKEADYRALLTERRDVLPHYIAVDWGEHELPPWVSTIRPQAPRAARWDFLARFKELGGKV